MSLLTDEEMRLIAGPRVDYFDHGVFGRAIEAKILAKLAGAELPEPKEFAAWGYTAAQLRQAYAQGAAAQLAHEPVGHFTFKGASQIWEETTKSSGTPLYTRREAK